MPKHRRRRSSGGFPSGALSLDQLGRRLAEIHARTPGYSVEEILRHRTRNLALQDSFNVFGQSLAAGSGAPGQLPVQSIRDVPYLDHLGHANSISHVPHMRNHHAPRAWVGCATDAVATRQKRAYMGYGVEDARRSETGSGTRGTLLCNPPTDNLIRRATQAHTRLVRDFGVGMAGRVSRSDAADA